MAVSIQIDGKAAGEKFDKNLSALRSKFEKALTATMNMAASMIDEEAVADINSAGNFGSDRWLGGLHVNVEGAIGNMRISMHHDVPYFGIFETGGVIKGNPLLWIGLSGTNAEGIQAKDFPGGLFSVQPKGGKHPLLLSIADKQPKYFGIESVTIPKKFHLGEIQKSVMANFRQMFDQNFKG